MGCKDIQRGCVWQIFINCDCEYDSYFNNIWVLFIGTDLDWEGIDDETI